MILISRHFFQGVPKPIDLFYLVDTSNGVSNSALEKMKEFVVSQGEIFSMSKDGARAALISYAVRPTVYLTIDDGVSLTRLKEAAQLIKRSDGSRHLEKALASVRDMINSGKEGERSDVPKVVVVFLAGKNAYSGLRELSKVVDELRRMRVDIVVIGIGSEVTDRELRDIATSPSSVNKVISEERLQDATAVISGVIINSPVVSTRLDLGFILGESKPSESLQFETAKKIISEILWRLEISPDKTRVGVIVYGSDAGRVLSMDQYYGKSGVIRRIKSLPSPSSVSVLSLDAMRRAINLFAAQPGTRNGVQKTAVLFINNNLDTQTKQALERLISQGIKVIAVYFGTEKDPRYLESLRTKGASIIIAGSDPDAKGIANDAVKSGLPGKFYSGSFGCCAFLYFVILNRSPATIWLESKIIFHARISKVSMHSNLVSLPKRPVSDTVLQRKFCITYLY